MKPLYEQAWFTFSFADDRIVPRFHLDGVAPGTRVAVFQIDPATGERAGVLAKTTVGDGGWVDLPKPILVRAGETFIAVPEVAPLIRPETPADYDVVHLVNRTAFGQNAEAHLVDALRTGGYSRLSLVAETQSRIVGHILFSDLPITTATGTISALALAPMAVLPEMQHLGIGSALVRRGLEMCREGGHRIVIVLGHVEYYPRFGFSAALARQLESPFSGHDAFMALELVPGALEGVAGRVQYAPPFGV